MTAGAPLPPRLARVEALLKEGYSDKDIAASTGLTFSTVRTYVRQVYARLGVHRRIDLLLREMRPS